MPRRIFRYRRPGINQLLGISQAKRRVSRRLGLATLFNPLTPINNIKRRVLRRTGYYSEPMKMARASGCLKRGGCGLMLLMGLGLLALPILLGWIS